MRLEWQSWLYKPWTRLFWKIFLWFWLTMTTLVVSLVVVIALVVDPAIYFPERHGLFHDLEIHGRRLEHEPSRRLQRANRSIRRPLNLPGNMYLFDNQGRSLGRQRVSHALQNFYENTRESRQFEIALKDGLVLVGPYRFLVGDEFYQLYLTNPDPNHVFWRLWQILSGQWIVLLTTLTVSSLFCLLLASYLVAPIRQLQSAARRIAQGDFETQVSPQVSRRKDEIGQLGHDFNIMSQQLNDLVGAQKRLLMDVSHELRSPLTRLQIALALARKKTRDTDPEHDRIELEISRLDSLIAQVIQWSRLDNRLVGEEKKWMELSALISDLIEDTHFEAESQEKEVRLVQSVVCHFQGNASILSSAIENIVRNAIRFAPPHTTIEVNMALRIENEQRFALIVVEDQGPGVPEESLEALFNPFYRVDETRGQKNNGSGLGMAIAQRAAEWHQGRIWAENRNPGLKVTLELPLSSNQDKGANP